MRYNSQQLPRIAPSHLVLPEVTPATRLLEKRRQQFEEDEALEAAKQEFSKQARERAFRAREEVLKRRDLELQESMLHFTHFLQENDAKRSKANRRAADEARLRVQCEAEAARLHAEADACRAQLQGMHASLQGAVRYRAYLQGVAEAGDACFQEVRDVVARHNTLLGAHAGLLRQHAACDAEAQHWRGVAEERATARAAELLDLNNRVAALKREVDTAAAEAAAQESAADDSRCAAWGRQVELSQVVAAIGNLHQRCLQRSRVPRARGEPGAKAQLEAIACFAGDFCAVVEAVEAGAAPAAGAGPVGFGSSRA